MDTGLTLLLLALTLISGGRMISALQDGAYINAIYSGMFFVVMGISTLSRATGTDIASLMSGEEGSIEDHGYLVDEELKTFIETRCNDTCPEHQLTYVQCLETCYCVERQLSDLGESPTKKTVTHRHDAAFPTCLPKQ